MLPRFKYEEMSVFEHSNAKLFDVLTGQPHVATPAKFSASISPPWTRKLGCYLIIKVVLKILLLQEVTKFHLQGSKDVVTMVSLMMDDSVSAEAFDLEQWIKVTSCGREKRS